MCKRSKINSILAAIYFISAKPDRSIVLYPISKLWCRRDYDGIVEPLYCLHRDHPTTSTYCHHPVGVVWLTILFFSPGVAFLSLAPSSAKGYYATECSTRSMVPGAKLYCLVTEAHECNTYSESETVESRTC